MRDRKTGTYIKHIHLWGPTRNFIRVKLHEPMAVIKKQKYMVGWIVLLHYVASLSGGMLKIGYFLRMNKLQ
ncbi:hypothetical protein BAVI_23679 [Neobacillus vireti LMG 21834]|uniref:Uncharacterized protein n=1 Tax=Neobacillus vireti LMG 21834 TaxID=1131730 RepID=A0AB94IGK3_9BACI|nr:hypothetical protein BAVI_23679 [Neobacillus vireti LMG 21834]KLT19951.1 hypothetical protein AA980_05265 [Neobacillus vireti]